MPTDEQDVDAKIIDARPTKSLFIDMLTKDIPLIRAILDLVDNSIDGARRARPDGNYTGLWIRLEVTDDKFKISDNCGGIPVDIARNYAFRFGRPEDAKKTTGSVGQFGVGMKRAIFKLGRKFFIESKTRKSRFTVDVDVEEWEKNELWTFEFKDLEEDTKISADQVGTNLEVAALNDTVVRNFKLENFRIQLGQELETAHLLNMNKGLAITLNGVPLQMRDLLFRYSNQIRPALREISLKTKPSPVKVRIYAGIAESNPSDAGWYVFCNGRMLLEKDKDLITGWGEDRGRTIPRFHNQYASFRGYVFFESDSAELLPWNTTKTGVDTDSPIYQGIRLQMVNMMRPIIDFLNALKESKGDQDDKDSEIETVVLSAEVKKIEEIKTFTQIFQAPKIQVKKEKRPDVVGISYSKPKQEAEAVKKSLGAKSWREVGEKTFEYYQKMEGD